MSTEHAVGGLLNFNQKTSEEGPVKRAIARLKHPLRARISDSSNEMAQREAGPTDGAHATTEQYAGAAGYAVAKECATYLQGDEGEAALRKVFMIQARVVYEVVLDLLMCDELKQASQMAGLEIVSGSSEGLERKLISEWKKLPTFVTVSILPIILIFFSLLMLGLLLGLWRFVLFGLQ